MTLEELEDIAVYLRKNALMVEDELVAFEKRVGALRTRAMQLEAEAESIYRSFRVRSGVPAE